MRHSRDAWSIEDLAKKKFYLYAAVFFLCGVAFLLFPNEILLWLNELGSHLGNFPPLAPSHHRFWVVLSFTMMVMIAYVALHLAKKLEKAWINLLLLSKGISSLGFLALYFCEQNAFAFIAGFFIDGLIFASILWLRLHPKLKNILT